jgi:methionyl-tRNA formyltransferase
VITAIEKEKGFYIQCSDGELLMEEVQPEGKKPMKALDFLNGARLKVGDRTEQ